MSRSETIRPGIVHRLDKDTSGLLVVAKNEKTHLALSSLFKSREVEKLYLALVYGRLDPKRGRIDRPLGRAHRHRTKMSTRSRHPRDALTEYLTLREFDDFSLLQIRLHTGRTHQIRVHLEDIGHPVVGDLTYAANRRLPTKPAARKAVAGLSRQFLHAASLEFRHPRTGTPISVQSPLPAELEDVLSRL